MTKKQFVKELRSWIGTKWQHGCAVKGAGADCAQIVAQIAMKAHWLPQDYKIAPYSRDWALHQAKSKIEEELKKFADKVDTLEVGDILLYKYGKCNSHMGIYIGDGKLIHSHIEHGVEEITLDDVRMKNHLEGAYRLRTIKWE